MTIDDSITFTCEDGSLRVVWEGDDYSDDQGIGVFIHGKEVYRASVVDSPREETAKLFDAFKAAFDAGFGAA